MAWNNRSALTCLSLLSVIGCGKPVDLIGNQPVQSSNTKSEQKAQIANVPEPSPPLTEAENTTNTAVAEATSTQPTRESPHSAPVEPIKIVAPAPEPSTSSAMTRLIDLQKFPRINAKGILDQGPTYVYYFGEASVKAADAFYQSEFKSAGWGEIPSNIPSSKQYFDRLFCKDGNYVRATVSEGSKAGEIGVSLSNLGNVDMQLLPKMDDAVPVDSTPVSAGHQTAKGIIEVAETLGKKLIALGWQEYRPYFTPDIDVPHYRVITYRKNAIRINLGIYRDPKNPAEKTKVFYLAEPGIPFDIPTPDHTQMLRLDMSSLRATFDIEADRKALLAMFESACKQFDWKLKNGEQFEKGDAASLIAVIAPEVGVVARIVDEKGKRSLSLERIAMPDIKPADVEVEDNVVAIAAASANITEGNSATAKSEADNEFDKIQSEVTNTFEAELKKALGSLHGGNSLPAGDLAKLQANATDMLRRMDKGQVTTEPAAPEKALMADTETLFPIPVNCTSKTVEGTKYLKQVEATVDSSITLVEAFYRAEFEKRGLTEKKSGTTVKNKMTYTSADGVTEVKLRAGSSNTTIELIVQNRAAAKADKVIASAGKGLVMMGNLSEESVEVSVAGKKFVLKPGEGAKDPKDSMRVELAPGSYTVEWKSKSGKSATESLELTENTTWGVLYDADLQMVMRIY